MRGSGASSYDDMVPAGRAALLIFITGAALAASLYLFFLLPGGAGKNVPAQLTGQNIADLLRQVEANPEDPQAFVELGWAYFTAGDGQRAEAAYLEALKLDSGYVPALTNLGLLMAERRKYDEAQHYFTMVYELSPGHELARFNLGVIAIKKGDYQSAKEHFSHSLRANPTSGDAWYYLGFTLEALGERDEALDAYRKAQSFLPNDSLVKKALNNLETKKK